MFALANMTPQTQPTLFISHASEDKDGFVRPLATGLTGAGLGVWYDEFEIKVGDSLRQKIDEGLKKANYGIVVLSKAFFAKKWTQLELNALFALEDANRRVILPIWLGVDAAAVREFSPMLADRVAISGDRPIDVIVEEIRTAISTGDRTREVTATAGPSPLQALANQLANQDAERARLRSSNGIDDVTEAVIAIAAAVLERIEAVNKGAGPKRFNVLKRGSGDSITVIGPRGVFLATALREIYVNTAEGAIFCAFVGVEPGPYFLFAEEKVRETIEFLPRAIGSNPIQWTEKGGNGALLSSNDVVGRIEQGFANGVEKRLKEPRGE